MTYPEKENPSEIPVKGSMNRRTFCAKCFSCTTGMVFLSSSGFLSRAFASAGINDSFKAKLTEKEIRKLFMQKGSCAHLYFYIMNNEYGHNKADEERAIDQLAGGLAEKGYQCGMLWGTSMGAAAEAYRQNDNIYQAMARAIFTTQQIINAFVEITTSPDCYTITSIDLSKRFSKLKMVFSAGDCFDLANNWYPRAIETSNKGLSQKTSVKNNITSCASEVVRKMGASEEEMVMVSGFAGGLGLSGNACGALSAAIWMKTLDWCRNNPEEKGYSYSGVQDIVALFTEATNGEMLCHKICSKRFNSIEDHTEFISNGGCEKIIDALAETKTSVDL